jgi:hypothetical protein
MYLIHLAQDRDLWRNYQGDQDKDEMGGACSTHGKDEKCI